MNMNDHTTKLYNTGTEVKLFLAAISHVHRATVLAKGLGVLWRMTTVHASKGTPLEEVYSYRRGSI